MSMVQMWTVIGIMAVAFAAILGLSYWTMIEQGKTLMARIDGSCGEINARMDGLRSEVTAQMDGLRDEVRAQIDGLRGEMKARFDHLTMRVEQVESIDREVHALSIKVRGHETQLEN